MENNEQHIATWQAIEHKVVWQAIEHNMMDSEVKHGEHPNVTWKQQ
jgi:hypothetical protein